jgi:hypothetical protein
VPFQISSATADLVDFTSGAEAPIWWSFNGTAKSCALSNQLLQRLIQLISPQGLKPPIWWSFNGTAKAVPFQISFCNG